MPRGKGVMTAEHRARIAAALKAKGIRPYCAHDDEWRRKVSRALKAHYAVPGNRERLDAARRKRWDNPQNRGGLTYWRTKLIKERGSVCEMCGEQTGRIELHHKNQDRSANYPENLMLLCRSCHSEIHKRDRNWLTPVFRALERAIGELGGTSDDKDFLYATLVRHIHLQYGLRATEEKW